MKGSQKQLEDKYAEEKLNLESELERAKKEHEGVLAKLESEKVALEAQLECLKMKNEAKETELADERAAKKDVLAKAQLSEEEMAKIRKEKEEMQEHLSEKYKQLEKDRDEQLEKSRCTQDQLSDECKQLEKDMSEQLKDATDLLDAEKARMEEAFQRRMQAEQQNTAEAQAIADEKSRALEALNGELKSSKAHGHQLQQQADHFKARLEEEQEQSQQALANERREKEALLKEKPEESSKLNDEVAKLRQMLEEKADSDEMKELREQLFNKDLETTTALSQASEAEAALKDCKARLTEAKDREEVLTEERDRLQAEDRRARKEEKARQEEAEKTEKQLRDELNKLNFVEKRSQMFEKKKKEAEQESKDLKKKIEQLNQTITQLELDNNKLCELEEHAAMRDRESEDVLSQNKGLLQTVQLVRQEHEQTAADNETLKRLLEEFEADLENTKHENAELASHNNHKQKVKYHMKIKEDKEALQKEVANLRHKLQQFETGHRGSSLLQALMNFGGGNNDPLGEMSVCGQSVCSTRVQEPRTPNPKGSATGVKTPRTQRTPSQGPLSARRGQTNVEAEPCRNCALQERASQRTIVDFQHFVALMERAVFIGDAGGDSTDPSSMLEQLRKIVAGGSGHANTQP